MTDNKIKKKYKILYVCTKKQDGHTTTYYFLQKSRKGYTLREILKLNKYTLKDLMELNPFEDETLLKESI